MSFFPSAKNKKEMSFRLTNFDGGINLKDDVTKIADNQLSYSMNLWQNDGALKTRPAVKINESIVPKMLKVERLRKIVDIKNNVTRKNDNKLYRLKADYLEFYNKNNRIDFSLINGSEEITLKSISLENLTLVAGNLFCFGKYIYCLLSLLDSDDDECFKIYRLENLTDFWEFLGDEDIYAPLIIKGCKFQIPGSDAEADQIKDGAEYVEGYNIIGNRYRMLFSTVNIKRLSNEVYDHFMSYRLLKPIKPSEIVGRTLSATITDRLGQVFAHSVTITDTNGWQLETINRGDDIYMGVLGDKLWFFTDRTYTDVAKITADCYKENNMEVSVPYKNTADKNRKIFNMNFNEWFGGGSDGLYTVTRLFLGGNVSEPSLIAWSSVNNPLYFSENSTTYIGDPSQKVTAFLKQNDVMLAFKEREILAVTYLFNNDYVNKNLLGEANIDAKKTFPIITLNSSIGCTLTDTLKLVGNRPVWLEGRHIYTLTANSDYSKSNVYEVSKMLLPLLKKQSDEQILNAVACDYFGNYILFLGNTAYLVDCNSYGFKNISSVSKEKCGEDYIKSFAWQLPISVNKSFAIGDELLFSSNEPIILNNENYILRAYYLFDNSAEKDFKIMPYVDEETSTIKGERVKSDIYCEFTTKQFDFGLPQKLKRPFLIDIILLENGSKRLKANAFTENGISNLGVIGFSQKADAQKNKNVKLYPSLSPTRYFGIGLGGYGRIAILDICFEYKI